MDSSTVMAGVGVAVAGVLGYLLMQEKKKVVTPASSPCPVCQPCASAPASSPKPMSVSNKVNLAQVIK